MSEAWSLDADPPESVMNDPLDDNTASLRLLNSSSSVNTNSDGRKLIDLNATSCANNLISFDCEQVNVMFFYFFVRNCFAKQCLIRIIFYFKIA